jgi:cysteinyl-tRNA synthetase
MGERRLAMLERELPESTYVLGVDEHTGVVIDLDTETASVVGKGVVTLRLRDGSTEIPSGETFPLDRLRDPLATATASPRPHAAPAPVVEEAADSNLRQATERLSGEFDAALAAGDADAAARSVLELEDVITSWSADTLQGTDGEFARATLRSMITRLAGAASSGLADPREVVGPYMDVLLTLRSQVRADKRFDLSDVIRDRLAAIGVEVRDTPTGAEWVLRD